MPNTIAENLVRLQNAKTAIANAITAKGGTVAAGDGLEDFPTDIATIPSGGSSVSANDVTFYDYDGTVVNSYSKADFLALSAMPTNPSHEGLTAQGWNWSLADAKAYVTKYGRLNIGQMYITSDGKTRIKIKLEEGRLEPVLGLGINGSVDVDWGDDTTHGTMTGSNVSTLVQLQHVYAAAGEYTIALTVTGSMRFLGDTTYKAAILRKAGVDGSTANESYAYQHAVKEIYIGNSVNVSGFAFFNCTALEYVTVHNAITFADTNIFNTCRSLRFIVIPDGNVTIGASNFSSCASLVAISIPLSVTSIGQGAFSSCILMSYIDIPDGVTSLGGGVFSSCISIQSIRLPDSIDSLLVNTIRYCYSLIAVEISDSITTIGNYVLDSCVSLASIKFKGATPPAVSGSTTFSGIPTDCIIYVPSGSLEDYEDETNYPDPDVYTYTEY